MKKNLAIFLCIVFILAMLLPVSAVASNTPSSQTLAVPASDFDFSNGTIIKYNGNADIVVIPSEIDGQAVLHIGPSAFSKNPTLKEVTVPEGVIDIGDSAFYECPALHYVSLPHTLTTLYDDAFESCKKLSEINFPERLKSIGYSAFDGCVELTDAVIPDSVEFIGKYAFSSCEKLVNVVLPQGLARLEYEAFAYCYSLKSIVIPDSVTFIDTEAFYDCYALESVTLSKNLTYIGYEAFAYLPVLESIEIPASVTYIGDSAFYDDTALKDLRLSEGLIYIDEYAFEDCSALESVVIPASVVDIESDAFESDTLLYSAYFLGNAPYWDDDIFGSPAPGFTIYYLSGNSGFTDPTFRGLNCVCLYKIDTPDTIGGTIKVSEDHAAHGDTILVNADPNSGFVLSSLYYRDSYGTHKITNGSFIMPASDVQLIVHFSMSTVSILIIVLGAAVVIGLAVFLIRRRQ